MPSPGIPASTHAARMSSPGIPASTSASRMSSPQRMCRKGRGSGNSESLYFRTMFLRVAVVVSGRGSNLAALLRALGADAPARVILVISNRAEAEGLAVARRQGVPTHVLQDSADPAEWRRVLKDARAELVVLAGYLKRVPEAVVDTWRGRMINIHPALLPRHGGARLSGRRGHPAVPAGGRVASGATVHLVTGEYDRGPIRS